MSKAKFANVSDTAVRLGVPIAWLRRESREGRVPTIHAGRRLLMDPDQVARVLEDASLSRLNHRINERLLAAAKLGLRHALHVAGQDAGDEDPNPICEEARQDCETIEAAIVAVEGNHHATE